MSSKSCLGLAGTLGLIFFCVGLSWSKDYDVNGAQDIYGTFPYMSYAYKFG
jgi:hypothetical protein